MKANRLTLRRLKDGDRVDFVAFTEKYGNAEFVFCLRFERGQIKKLFITPKQQPDAKHRFEVDASYGATGFHLSSYTHKGMDRPWPWIHFWCEEHKAFAFSAYVPKQATHFKVQTLSSLCVTFDKEETG